MKRAPESDVGGPVRQERRRAPPVPHPDVLHDVEHRDGGVSAAGVEAGERALEAGGLVVQQVGQAHLHLAAVVPAAAFRLDPIDNNGTRSTT